MLTLDFWKPKGDRLLWISVLVLATASLVFIYSSTGKLTFRKNDGMTSYYLWKQIILLGMGYVVIAFFQNFSCRKYLNFAGTILFVCIILLLVAMMFGSEKNGAGRWMPMPFGLSFQPSELAKLATVMYVARDISYNQSEKGYHFDIWRWLLPIATIVIIFMENVSTAVLLASTCFIMVFVGRLPWKTTLKTVGSALAGVVVLLALILAVPESAMQAHEDMLGRIPTLQSRILHFMDEQPLEEMEFQEIMDNQSIQSRIAIASGGLLGKGPGNSTQCNILPEPYSDFIFAIILEELGVSGLLIIILCYVFLLITAFRIMFRCKSLSLGLFVVGIAVCLVLQAIIHMSVSVGIIPVTGQTLPLVSKGGTSTLIVAMEIGMILSVSREVDREMKAEAEEAAEEEVVEEDA